MRKVLASLMIVIMLAQMNTASMIDATSKCIPVEPVEMAIKVRVKLTLPDRS